MRVTLLKRNQIHQWSNLRKELWPALSPAEHRREMTDILADSEFNAVFVAVGSDGNLHGFVEASIRLTAEGCRPGRIGYIEGWYVEPKHRRKGVGTALVKKAEAWAVALGCDEMASDSEVGNEDGRLAHASLGYEETGRLIHFRKKLKEK